MIGGCNNILGVIIIKTKILIIEDNNEINDMLKILLTQNGYDTASAYSGTEGLLVHDDSINLILLDLMLPGKSGEDIIKDLKEKNNIPVIVISAIHDIGKKVDLFTLGADDYITKPFHNDELLARIAARLRSGNEPMSKNSMIYKDIEIDKSNFTAKCSGKIGGIHRMCG